VHKNKTCCIFKENCKEYYLIKKDFAANRKNKFF